MEKQIVLSLKEYEEIFEYKKKYEELLENCKIYSVYTNVLLGIGREKNLTFKYYDSKDEAIQILIEEFVKDKEKLETGKDFFKTCSEHQEEYINKLMSRNLIERITKKYENK